MESKGKSTREIGRSCVNQRTKVAWDSKICSNLMRQCLTNRCGGYYMIRILCSTGCSKKNISLMERCLMQKRLSVHMHGRVY